MKKSWEKVLSHFDDTALRDLAVGALRIPSYSGEEYEVGEFFARAMRELGMTTEVQPVPPDDMMTTASINAIGRLPGADEGNRLLFNGHMDHNPVCEGWTKDPFGGVVEDDWLYGFVHMKAADAAYLAAIDAVQRSGIVLARGVAVALVCGELRGGTGTKHALKQGLSAEFFVLGEPTELDIAFRHTASIVVDLHVLGQMKHFATVDVPGRKGVNAVEKMAKVIAALGPSHTPLPSRDAGGWLDFTPVPGFEGLPQLNIGSVRGGISRNYDRSRPALMPDYCSVTVDFRIVPGMSKVTIEADLKRLIDELLQDDPDIRVDTEFGADTFPLPFESATDSPVAKSVWAAHEFVTGRAPEESQVLKFAASDASWMGAANIPGIIYGPTGKYLSRPDERGRLQDIINAGRAYACVIADLCSTPTS